MLPIHRKACQLVEQARNQPLPFRERGIKIDQELIKATIDILIMAPSKTLPQNCRNDIRVRTPDGLDRRIKDVLNTDLRTANIVSDVLAECSIVKIVKVVNPDTGRLIKGTRLLDEIFWGKDSVPAIALEFKTFTKTKGDVLKSSPGGKTKKVGQINKELYLASKDVIDFISWFESKLNGANSFSHSYYLKLDRRNWRCSCFYDAYKSYWWRFNTFCPVTNRWVSGTSLQESFEYLTRLAKSFRKSIRDNNTALARKCALSALKWGGVEKGNRERIIGLGKDICAHFRDIQEQLDLSSARLNENQGIHINSGFTKLYFLLIDDFMMYDGRVGAAMGLMVRKFCEENDLYQIPRLSQFSYGPGRESRGSSNRRDPSLGHYQFSQFSFNPRRHLQDNIKASWLLKAVADNTKSRFSRLPQDPPLNERLTALQSALFMIGYDVR